jgi:hypothetical protein
LLKADQWSALFDMPSNEESLVRHCTLGHAEMDLIQAKRTPHNRLGLAIQLCFLRHLGRAILPGETPPAPMVAFLAQQIDSDPGVLVEYGRRDTTRREHAVEAQRHLGLHPPGREDRRAALSAALAAAATSDRGMPIAEAMIAAFQERKSVLPASDTLDRIGRAARVVARRRMEAALLDGLSSEELATIDGLLAIDPVIRQTRFAWLRAFPEAPSEKNLLALLDRLSFVRSFGLDPRCRVLIDPDRWAQLVREGAVTPSWLAEDFNPRRRHALITAQLIELTGKLTDATITTFCRLIALLFTKSKARQDRRHLDARKETGRLLRMFGDTLRALAEANETGKDAFDVLDREIGWPRLVQARVDVEALAATAEADPLLGAAERYSGVRRYAPALLEAFTFRSSRARDPLLTAIELLRQLNRDGRRALPTKVPVGHLTVKVRKLIAVGGKRDRRVWEIATLAVLRDRLRSGDVWVEGSRAFRSLEAHLMPSPTFEARKQAGDLRLGVPHEANVWIAEKQQELDFKLKQLSYRARTGKLAGICLVDGVLTIAKHRTKVPKAQVDAAKWLILDRMPQIEEKFIAAA